jgi:hypothetical protein
MKRKTNTLLKTCIDVPPYHASYWLIVAKDAYRARAEMSHIFGDWEIKDMSFTACHCYTFGGTSGLFFHERWLTHEHIAHEIFHAAHRILQWAGAQFDVANQEPHSHMMGWLAGKTYAALKKAGLRIR